MLRIFYNKVVVLNKEHLRFTPPCIVVSNHPSTLTDPLNVAHKIKHQLFFLANAGLFKSKFGSWFFNTFYCIPVERPQDVNGRRIRNDDAFIKCDQHLSSNGCLYIAPQGVSKMVRRLGYSIKTGTARIALSAESKNDFKLGLTILPIGLTYTKPTDFRSGVINNAGKHIQVADYKSIYLESPPQAVAKLTSDLENQMRSLLLDTEDEHEELLVERMEAILDSEHKLAIDENFLRTKKLIPQLHHLKDSNLTAYQDLETRVNKHFEQLDQSAVDVNSLFQKSSLAGSILVLILGFPIWLYGWTNNFLANFIPGLLAKKLKIYRGYNSTIKIMSGFITYPIFYGLQIYLVHHFGGNGWLTWAYFISLPIFGLLAWAYSKHFAKTRSWIHWNSLNKESPNKRNGMLDAQINLAAELKKLIGQTS